MLKVYTLHENEYRRMKAAGIESWEQRNSESAINEQQERFWLDAMVQPWFPAKGKVLEIGCGTGPILRWFAGKGYRGDGLDVSSTAIAMAKELAKGSPTKFKQGDICTLDTAKWPKYDLCIDGNCLHCLTHPDDRKAMLTNARRMLKDHGILLIMTMCAPIDINGYRRLYPNQIFKDGLVYVPANFSEPCEGEMMLGGKKVMPTRCIAPWKRILREIADAGFDLRLMRLNRHHAEDVVSSLSICASI